MVNSVYLADVGDVRATQIGADEQGAAPGLLLTLAGKANTLFITMDAADGERLLDALADCYGAKLRALTTAELAASHPSRTYGEQLFPGA